MDAPWLQLARSKAMHGCRRGAFFQTCIILSFSSQGPSPLSMMTALLAADQCQISSDRRQPNVGSHRRASPSAFSVTSSLFDFVFCFRLLGNHLASPLHLITTDILGAWKHNIISCAALRTRRARRQTQNFHLILPVFASDTSVYVAAQELPYILPNPIAWRPRADKAYSRKQKRVGINEVPRGVSR
ncbi:hypothetical protein KC344_g149 [Hortaea werneckii]|nr:hypothetical protein KC344_g149 [Hortaea werneckii]